MKKGKLSFLQILLLFGLVPLTTAVLLLSTIAYITLSSELEDDTYQTLMVAARSMQEHYATAGLDTEVKDHTYVDSLTQQGIELTVFTDDTRYLTSIKDNDGARIEGTKADNYIYNTVTDNQLSYSTNNVAINGKDYYVCYVPLYDVDHSVVGMSFAGKSMEEVEQAKMSLLGTIATYAVLIYIVFIVLILIVANIVRKPMRLTADALRELSTGNVSYSCTINSIAKETLDIVSAYYILQENLRNIISTIRTSGTDLEEDVSAIDSETKNVSSSASQISTTVHELAEASQNMAMSVQDVNEAVTTIDDEITAMRQSISELVGNSESIKIANSSAYDAIREVVSSNEDSVTATDAIAEQIKLTSASVSGIRNVLSMISGVASQTKLLSLNASIEAARAGEAGMGFSVVASEIQKLSDESNKGVEQIQKLATDMLAQAETSLKLSSTVQEKMNVQSKLLSDVDNLFNELSGLITDVVNHIASVQDSVNSVDNVKATIVSSVQDLSAISQENAASNEEVSASVETVTSAMADVANDITDISKLTNKLMEAVSQFK